MATMGLAQTQQGYVKTKGRMDAKGNLIHGQGLKGATVSIKGRTTILVNAEDGSFSFPITENQFRLDSVQKKGYQLVDMDALGKIYKHSANPLYLVMETPEQQLQDKLNAEKKIRKNLQKQLDEREIKIENLKAQQKISEEEYRTALQKLYQEQRSNEKLISDMAKRYSELDYDQLDEFYRVVSYCIENGELVKADSLLKTRGDIKKQVADIMQQGQAILEEKKQLQKAEAVHEADIEEAARRCYSYYETFAAQYQNDSAAYYLELRASLDTTNVEWQNEVGLFILKYTANYDKALSYFNLGLRQALEQNGEQNNRVSTFYNNLGVTYHNQGDYGKALEYTNKALTIRKTLLGDNHPDVAKSYNGIGVIYDEQGDYIKALEYYNKALSIWLYCFKEDQLDEATYYNNILSLATCFNNIGSVFFGHGDFNEALENYNKALSFYESIFGDSDLSVARCYSNLGLVYNKLGEYNKALEFSIKALNIRKTILGEKHPDVALCYNNIGLVYGEQNENEKAMEYYNNALTIWKCYYGEKHQHVATCYDNLGSVYSEQGDFNKALDCYDKALSINESILGENHLNVAICCNNIGVVYDRLGEHTKALDYYYKVLSILIFNYGEDHPAVATCFNNIGLVYDEQGDYSKALEYYKMALTIHETKLGKNHPDTANSYGIIGQLYQTQGDLDKAMEYYGKALTIMKSCLGENNPNSITIQQSINYLSYQQALTNNTIHHFNEDHCYTATIIDGETPASEQGMSGEYILLEFSDWNQDSPTSLFDKNNELRGKPKDILVMKDGHISQHHFENTIGMQMEVKHIGKEEKQRINKAYEEWKKQNRQQP